MHATFIGAFFPRRPAARGAQSEAFTLAELLVATALVSILLLVAAAVIGTMSTVYKKSLGTLTSFQEARLAFETMTRYLSQSTLNTYTDYDSATNPKNYLRKSDLRFLCGSAGQSGLPGTTGSGQAVFFETPAGYTANPSSYAGMSCLLNTCGYYVLFAPDSTAPSFLTTSATTYRYRLMQLQVPTELPQSVYPSAPATNSDWTMWFSSTAWFSNFVATGSSYVTPIAENVIALIVRLQDPSNASATPPSPPDINPDYTYDTALNATSYPQPVTANQLPPVIQVTLVAIDEGASLKLQNGSTPPLAITQALNGKFTQAANYSADLANLQAALDTAHITYRIFSNAVPVLETKWSK